MIVRVSFVRCQTVSESAMCAGKAYGPVSNGRGAGIDVRTMGGPGWQKGLSITILIICFNMTRRRLWSGKGGERHSARW